MCQSQQKNLFPTWSINVTGFVFLVHSVHWYKLFWYNFEGSLYEENI